MTNEERKILFKMWYSYQPSPLKYSVKEILVTALICAIVGIIIGIASTIWMLSRTKDLSDRVTVIETNQRGNHGTP